MQVNPSVPIKNQYSSSVFQQLRLLFYDALNIQIFKFNKSDWPRSFLISPGNHSKNRKKEKVDTFRIIVIS